MTDRVVELSTGVDADIATEQCTALAGERGPYFATTYQLPEATAHTVDSVDGVDGVDDKGWT